jgi:predicted trehalose synthase
MLRSFHYAAAVGRSDWGPRDVELDRLALGWEELNRAAFLRGYLHTEGIEALLPSTEGARAAVLAAFELDKAVYEVAYELAHRPDQVDIPLAGVHRLLATPAP